MTVVMEMYTFAVCVTGLILYVGDHKASGSLVCNIYYVSCFIAFLFTRPVEVVVGGFVIDVSNVFANYQLDKLVWHKFLLRNMADLIKYQGGCHCGAVLFEVYAPKTPAIIHCK